MAKAAAISRPTDLLESDDVHRWVSWLIENQHPVHVFGMGESLGAAVLLESLAVETRFSAIVADSSFSSFERIGRDRVAERLPVPNGVGRMLAAPPVWAGFLYARLRYGLDFRQASPEAALARSSTPVLLIHGLNDEKTPYEHSKILAASNRRSTTLWLVPGQGIPAHLERRQQSLRNVLLASLRPTRTCRRASRCARSSRPTSAPTKSPSRKIPRRRTAWSADCRSSHA